MSIIIPYKDVSFDFDLKFIFNKELSVLKEWFKDRFKIVIYLLQ